VKGAFRFPRVRFFLQGRGAIGHEFQAGFERVRNMKGGILAWSDRVDRSVPKY